MSRLSRSVSFAFLILILLSRVSSGQNCPNQPVNSSPAPDATGVATTTSLAWTASANPPDSYEVFWGAAPSTCVNLPNKATVPGNVTTFTPPMLTSGSQYQWRVVAHRSSCPDVSSFCTAFTTKADCPSPAITLLAPAAGATVTSNSVNFSWQSAGASLYELWIRINGGTPAIAFSTAGTTATLDLPSGTHEWWIVARFGTACSPVSSSHVKLNVSTGACVTIVPTLTSPPDGATGVANPVTFAWNPLPGATTYEVWIGQAAGEASLLGSTTETKLSRTIPAGTYAWVVRAYFPGCPAVQSVRWSFTVNTFTCPDAGPVLKAPAEGSSVRTPVTLSWTPLSGAVGYGVNMTVNDAKFEFNTRDATITVPLPSGNASWQVVAFFDTCSPKSSAGGSFVVAADAGCSSNAAAALKKPDEGITAEPVVRFEWTAVPKAVAYRVVASVDGGAVQFLGETPETQFVRALPEGNITWAIVTIFDGCPPTTSAEGHFKVKALSCDHAPAQLTAPANGATDLTSPVTFSWSAVSGAVGYRVWALVGNGPPLIIGSTNSNTTTITAPVPSGHLEWGVETMFDGCPPAISLVSSFTVRKNATCDTNPTATPTAPANGATGVTSPVTFSWNKAEGAFGYRVVVSIDGRPFEDLGETPDTSFKLELRGNTVEWFVTSFFPGCPPTFSSHSKFTMGESTECNTTPPTVTSPALDASVTSPVEFAWTASTNVIEYRVWIMVPGKDPIIIGGTPDTSMKRMLPPGTYTWVLETLYERCPPKRSEPRGFTVKASSSCSGEKPVLLSPADDSKDLAPPVTLSWATVSDAFAYRVWIAPDDGAPAPLEETRNTTMTLPLPPGHFRWTVQAVFAGCDPTMSAPYEFEVRRTSGCERPRPALILPPEGHQVLSPVEFGWTPVGGATAYKIYAAVGDNEAALIGSAKNPPLITAMPSGNIVWWVEATFDSCPSLVSPNGRFVVLDSAPPCGTPLQPIVRSVGKALSGDSYEVHWTPVPNADIFEIQESTNETFSDALTTSVSGSSQKYSHTATTPTPYFYRVRAVSSCMDARGAYSDPIRVIVVPAAGKEMNISFGTQTSYTQQLFVPGIASGSIAFAASTDQQWLTVTPASGTLPPEGFTLTLTADPRTLNQGTNTGTVKITTGSSKSRLPDDGASSSSVPVSVSVVTPVAPGGKTSPPSDAMIIPAVAHADGINSKFVSDIRLANISAQIMSYQLNFTQSGKDGTQYGKSTSIQVEPGQTMAVDDIVSNWFGLGATSGENATGMLEIRPMNAASSSSISTQSAFSLASSRTYNTTPTGTFGQFIPAVAFSRFVGAGTSLSLQQVAQSSSYRTNLGLVEGSGASATVNVVVYDDTGAKVTEFPETLQPGEHKQFSLASKGVSVDDGRIEVTVTSTTGKVTAYASVLDSATSDPLLVSPVATAQMPTASKYVIPGVADLQNGTDSWRTDVRIYNPETAKQKATLAYYPQGSSAVAASVEIELAAGQVRKLDSVLQATFNQTGTFGAIHISTANSGRIVATARTYNQTASGTYGQFIPSVTSADAIGLGDRALQILQLEQSDRFRSNVGIAEVTGQAATVEISGYVPGQTAAAVITKELGGNVFIQISKLLQILNLGTAYNARVTVKVIGGSGKVSAYGSMIDNQTQDPTYVPAQ